MRVPVPWRVWGPLCLPVVGHSAHTADCCQGIGWVAGPSFTGGCQAGGQPLGLPLGALLGSRLDSAQLQLAQNYSRPNYNNLVTAQREESSLIKRDGLDAMAGEGNSWMVIAENGECIPGVRSLYKYAISYILSSSICYCFLPKKRYLILNLAQCIQSPGFMVRFVTAVTRKTLKYFRGKKKSFNRIHVFWFGSWNIKQYKGDASLLINMVPLAVFAFYFHYIIIMFHISKFYIYWDITQSRRKIFSDTVSCAVVNNSSHTVWHREGKLFAFLLWWSERMGETGRNLSDLKIKQKV